MTSAMIGRRQLMLGSASLCGLLLAGCATTNGPVAVASTTPVVPPDVLAMYAARPEEQFPVPAVQLNFLEPRFYRQEMADPTGELPGTVVVETANRYLYLVRENGRALRYGVGIGRDGFAWAGRARIAYKRAWPKWTPPAEMIERQPELEQYRYGMPPGTDNPLGARALYIFQNGRDTLYRLHGNGDVHSIGKAVSSGCVRLLHQDVIDLYERVPDGSPILVV
ncbi:MAG: L,D-transpeptidase [Devosia sp.]|nr:L,D-transpeptidase [Devosia sp.]